MAEERIILTIDDGYCQEKCSCFPIACSAECEHIDKPTFSYARQEAIERMVLAMHNEEIKRSIKDIPCDYRNLAEAALNSLLEVGNGN